MGNTVLSLLAQQKKELSDLWNNEGHFGFYEADPVANKRTRMIIKEYAKDNPEAYLVHGHNGTMTKYIEGMKIYNFDYSYIAQSKEEANKLLAIYRLPHDKFTTALFSKDFDKIKAVSLVWA